MYLISGKHTLWSVSIPKKISKIGATRCQISITLKCIRIDFRWSSAPDPTGGANSSLPDPLAVFKGLLLRGRRGRGREEGKGRGREREGEAEEKGREGRTTLHTPSQIPDYATAKKPYSNKPPENDNPYSGF